MLGIFETIHKCYPVPEAQICHKWLFIRSGCPYFLITPYFVSIVGQPPNGEDGGIFEQLPGGAKMKVLYMECQRDIPTAGSTCS
jgi:hypothetical protein